MWDLLGVYQVKGIQTLVLEMAVTFPNQVAQLFNAQLKSLIAELSTNLQGSMFVYADVYHILENILENYVSYGMFPIRYGYGYHRCQTLQLDSSICWRLNS